MCPKDQWCPYCYANGRGRAAYKGHRSYRPGRPILKCEVRKVQKPIPASSSFSDPGANFEDPEFIRSYPTLYHYLFDVVWDDGTQRETATLLLFADAGRLKACLKDRALHRSAFVSSSSLDGVFEALERGLLGEGLDWRAEKVFPKKRGG